MKLECRIGRHGDNLTTHRWQYYDKCKKQVSLQLERVSENLIGGKGQKGSNTGLDTILIRAKSVFLLIPLWSTAFNSWSNKRAMKNQNKAPGSFQIQICSWIITVVTTAQCHSTGWVICTRASAGWHTHPWHFPGLGGYLASCRAPPRQCF